MNLELKKFDMKNISFKANENNGPVIVFIGRRDTGKSFLVRDLLYYHQDIPIGTVISGTESGNGFYAQHVPKLFIHDEYNTAIIAHWNDSLGRRSYSSPLGYFDYELRTPWKISGSAAYIFRKHGLISFDYNYKDYSF